MKLALECPTNMLSAIQPLADFDFALTHLVLSDKEYAEYYRNSTRFKILDNSTNENLKPCSLDDIKAAAEIIQPDLIVAPDYLVNHFATEVALEECLKIWPGDRILPVVQGLDLSHVVECAMFIETLGFWKKIAVPYDITCSHDAPLTDMATARKKVVQILTGAEFVFDVHLLGLTTLEEVSSYSNNLSVVSIDTGSPVLHGSEGKWFGRDPLLPKSQPTMNRMRDNQDLSGEYPEINYETVYYNIAYLRKVCKGEV